MANNIVKLYPKNAADNPDLVLEQAIGNYEHVFILGFNKEELLDFRCDSSWTHQELLWVVESFKRKLMNGDYSNDD